MIVPTKKGNYEFYLINEQTDGIDKYYDEYSFSQSNRSTIPSIKHEALCSHFISLKHGTHRAKITKTNACTGSPK